MVSYTIDNQEELKKLFKDMEELGTNRFIMGELARIVKKFSKANFILKGSGRYEPLSPKYKKQKERLRPATPMLVYDGTLRDSIVGLTKDSILEIGNAFARVGTRLDYAKYLDEGTNKMPARKPLFLTEKMVEQMIKIYEANIEKGLKRL